MNYSIHITAAAEKDFVHAADYIEFHLKNPQAAGHLLDEAETQTTDSTLCALPLC